MTIIYVSDFDLRGSGYATIALNLCQQLAEHYQVMALGLGYHGQEHYHPFKIVPVRQLSDITPMLRQLRAAIQIEAIIVALDIPLQEKIIESLDVPGELPYIGLFPLESGPLCASWAMSLLRMDARLIMSQFGRQELHLASLDSDFIPIGIDTEIWRPPTWEEHEMLRQGLGVDDDTFVILTVADNQERKNLSRTMEIFSDFSRDRRSIFWLVTRPRSPVGWKLEDYAMQLGIMDRIAIWERGMPIKQLWGLYAAANAFLLTSKAEGLALPVLEAMACRLPVIGTRCAAIEEHLSGDRGLLIEPDYVMIDPWGNSRRYLAGREDGVYKLKLWQNGLSPQDKLDMLDQAQAYVRERTWSRAGQILIEMIEQMKATRDGASISPVTELAGAAV